MPTLVPVKHVRRTSGAEPRPDLPGSNYGLVGPYQPLVAENKEEREDAGPRVAVDSTPRSRIAAEKKEAVKPKRIRRPPVYKVTHNYHDYSQTSVAEYLRLHPKKKLVRELKNHPPFTSCLHALLDYARATEQENVVAWPPHGRAFIVYKPEEFAEKILPVFFQHTKWSSFQRQLNLYDFLRLTKGRDAGAYYHELFLRGRPDLGPVFSRQKIKGTRHKGAYNPDEEPRLYSFPAMAWPCSSRPSFAQEINDKVRTTNYMYACPASTEADPVCTTAKALASRSTTGEQMGLAAMASSAQTPSERDCLLLLGFHRSSYTESRKHRSLYMCHGR